MSSIFEEMAAIKALSDDILSNHCEAKDIEWEMAPYKCTCGWHGDDPVTEPKEKRVDVDHWVPVDGYRYFCPNCTREIEA